MAGKIEGDAFPAHAASSLAGYVPVSFLGSASALSETVVRAGSWNTVVAGISKAAASSPGDPVSVMYSGVAKLTAAASLGAGAYVAVGTTTGRLVPQAASGVASPASTGEPRYIVGIALKNAADGDVFPVLLRPGQVI